MAFQFMGTIKGKLIGIIVAAVILSLSLSSFLIYYNANKTLTNSTEQTILLLARSSSTEIGLWLEEKKSYITTLANTPAILNGDQEIAIRYLAAEMTRLHQYETILVASETGDYYSSTRDGSGAIVTKKGSIKDRPYFSEAMQGKTVLSDPVLSKDTGHPIAVVAVPIKRDGKVVGVMGGSIVLEDLIQRVKSIKAFETGYAFVAQSDGVVIVHPDKNLDMKYNFIKDTNNDPALRQALSQMVQGHEGVARYAWNKEDKYLGYSPVPGVKWGLAVAVPVAEVNAQLTVMARISLITPLVIALLIIGLTSMLVTRLITRPLSEISDALQHFNNDLSLRLQIVRDDEVGNLAQWFNGLIQDLHQIISKVAEGITSVSAFATNTAETVDQQASFSMELSSSVAEISATMEEFASSSTQIAKHSQGVADLAGETLERSRQGVADVEALTDKLEEANSENQKHIQEIEVLGYKSQEINKIMEIINNIANQTRLIAFNAALEAASAGEAGKRFGVVAVEIRHLADSVMESVKEIESKTSEIIKAVNRQIVTSEKNAKSIQEGFDYSRRTVSIIREIQEAAEHTTDAVQQISLSIQQQQTASEQVVAALRQIQDGTKENSAMIHRTNLVSKDLAALAEEQKRLIEVFKL